MLEEKAMRLPAWLRIALLLLAGAAAYSNIAGVPFLFDDWAALAHNSSLRTLGAALLQPPRDTTLAGRPLANFSFAVNYAVSGLRLAPMHWTNLALHLLAGLLLMALVRRTLLLPRFSGRYQGRADGIALVAALLWVVHPVQTESVTYLVQRVESLAGFFLLLTLYASLRARLARRPFAWGAAAVLSCGLGMASKETMAVAPLVVLLFDRAFFFDSLRGALRARGRLYAGLAGTWLVLALQVATNPRKNSLLLDQGAFLPWQYLAIQAGAVSHYLRLLLVPVGLVFDYGEAPCAVPLAHFSDWAAPGALVLLLLALSIRAFWRNSPAGLPALAFFVLLAPSSSVVPIATEVISEHRLYLPSAAAMILVVVAADRLLASRRALAATLAAGAVLACIGLTYRRNQDYRSEVGLWKDDLRKRPDNGRAWAMLAAALEMANDKPGADQAYLRALRTTSDTCHAALRRDPSYSLLLRQAAYYDERNYDVTGDKTALEAAIDEYRRFLSIEPGVTYLQLNLAHSLEKSGRLDEAAAQYRAAMAQAPGDPAVAADAANCFARAGRTGEAAAAYQKSLALDPGSAVGHFNYAVFLARGGDYPAALQEFDRALALDRTRATIWYRRGLVASWAGRGQEAVTDLRNALRLGPDRGIAEELAWLLATHPDAAVRDGAKALRLAEAADHERRTARSLDVLGAAQAELGRFDEARRSAEQAMAQGAEAGARLESYRQRKPWRETPAPPK
jgi:protein O-mannosyl-transferase